MKDCGAEAAEWEQDSSSLGSGQLKIYSLLETRSHTDTKPPPSVQVMSASLGEDLWTTHTCCTPASPSPEVPWHPGPTKLPGRKNVVC